MPGRPAQLGDGLDGKSAMLVVDDGKIEASICQQLHHRWLAYLNNHSADNSLTLSQRVFDTIWGNNRIVRHTGLLVLGNRICDFGFTHLTRE
jgi:hypothetical protein